MSRVAIIDHGLGNLQAVEKALVKAGGGSTVFRCYDPDALRRADVVVLPGTGRLTACVDELRRLGMAELLPELLRDKPVLAINIGLHALGRQGLGLLDFDTQALNADGLLDARLPHLGWNRVHTRNAHPVWDGIPQDCWFYFAHNARAVAPDEQVVATCEYTEKFPAVMAHERLIGVQFQPEISHDNGLRFLANFVNWDGRT
ncbi:MAG: imidazole glycerol phosphate synthase subunit HisH [Proteobacteria bacterium]|nr:imidazole glycerol phosphate synthase subunit HisH [Pseudomonadota bacterium]